MAAAANASNAIVSELAAAGLYPTGSEAMSGHRYLVEFHREPSDPDAFARVLDQTLQKGNEDYATHCSYGLLSPAVDSLPRGTFVEFMRKRGKIGGQNKVPRVLDPSQLADLDATITQHGFAGRTPGRAR